MSRIYTDEFITLDLSGVIGFRKRSILTTGGEISFVESTQVNLEPIRVAWLAYQASLDEKTRWEMAPFVSGYSWAAMVREALCRPEKLYLFEGLRERNGELVLAEETETGTTYQI